MEDLNSLELLKSLTLGVNNKINQEQDSEIEYIVDTSLSNKRKKSAPPIIKEVIKENKSEDNILDDETFYESDIVEEPLDIIEDSFDNVEEDSFDMIIEDESLETIVEEEFIGDSEEDFLIESKSEEREIFIEDTLSNKNNTVDVLDNGHISEELVKTKKKDKIERNGNPFKRGPRKKKEKVVKSVELEPIEVVDTPFERVGVIEDQVVSKVEEEVIDETYLDELHSLDDSEFDSLFSDFEEDVEFILNEEMIEDEHLDIDVEEEEETEETEEVLDSEMLEEVEDRIEVDISEEVDVSEEVAFSEETEIEETFEVENVENSEENIVENLKKDFDFLDSFEEKEEISTSQKEESISEKIESTENTEEDAKFKDCVYYKGMSVEEFLRQNPNYRETLYVEHFFSKEELNKLMMSGLLLIKKGKYRL